MHHISVKDFEIIRNLLNELGLALMRRSQALLPEYCSWNQNLLEHLRVEKLQIEELVPLPLQTLLLGVLQVNYKYMNAYVMICHTNFHKGRRGKLKHF
jgi:hypothetical protein